MKVSKVSVSRRAGPPHLGHLALTKLSSSGRGERPSSRTCAFSGRRTGRSSKGTGTMPHFSQCTTGMGAPQKRCREMPQSRRR